MPSSNEKITTIGVFYDGHYFSMVSNYYFYYHTKKARISIPGFHEFICNEVAINEEVNSKYCKIVDAHYFRGRLAAKEADKEPERLINERGFEDVLSNAGVTTHYLFLKRDAQLNQLREKGIDVFFALETYEQTILKHFDVCVLIASDGDYIPLVKKLHALGTRVMVIGWDLAYTDQDGKNIQITTSIRLINEATYYLPMHDVIPNLIMNNSPFANNLFVNYCVSSDNGDENEVTDTLDNYKLLGRIHSLNSGYGFIDIISDSYLKDKRIYFNHIDLVDCDLASLNPNDIVEFELGSNYVGKCAKNVRYKAHEENPQSS